MMHYRLRYPAVWVQGFLGGTQTQILNLWAAHVRAKQFVQLAVCRLELCTPSCRGVNRLRSV
jgi:hypothetical protein